MTVKHNRALRMIAQKNWMIAEIEQAGYRCLLLKTQHKKYPYKLIVSYSDAFPDNHHVRGVFHGADPVAAIISAHHGLVWNIWKIGA